MQVLLVSCSNTFINKSAEAQMPMYHVNVVGSQAPVAGIKNNSANEAMTELVLYPNPAKEQSRLKLNMNAAGDVTLSIYEITGKLVQQGNYNLSEGVNTIDMDTNSLAKGMYLVTINSGSAKKTVRLIKE
ncbi:MAG: T9SS type A sorting domain-containing protein [Sphingobacteriaceae bacterium]|nr:T9SS type A sorting domain-containing protein [Sphingobacteriaceae bacterium]